MHSLTKGLPITRHKIKREFGLGSTIGFTDDGFVFFVADTQTERGAPMQTHFYWDPDQAQNQMTADSITGTALTASRWHTVIIRCTFGRTVIRSSLKETKTVNADSSHTA